jgi:hypothetical protein
LVIAAVKAIAHNTVLVYGFVKGRPPVGFESSHPSGWNAQRFCGLLNAGSLLLKDSAERVGYVNDNFPHQLRGKSFQLVGAGCVGQGQNYNFAFTGSGS